MSSETRPRYVIFDTDMGADDAWALQMILKAEKLYQNVKILAITTVNGNTTPDNAVKNTYRILDGVSRTDIPIYKGPSPKPLCLISDKQNGKYFGSNGFGDIEFWKPHYPKDINEIIQRKNAVEIIRELVMERPHEITIIAIGPLTNVALAIKTYPEIVENIKEIFIMGGNYKGRGNLIKGAEFNFFSDPEAAHIVLDSFSRPITIVPLECGLEDSISIPMEWRWNVLGNVDSENVKLLNDVERVAFRNKKIYTPFDVLLVAVFLFPEKCIKTKRSYFATIELNGLHTRGQMIFDRNNINHNVNVIETVYEEEIKEALLWSVTT